ncbi:hypothetical protein B0H63DRAFT_42752 [Podospora didyma]|uniref:Mid2 domain-containing protein n=1 Tax=Podospora didyma TaxID=330526 RepID=A0AAE0U8C6_9PEZI|nr:hypothetical protein B0H63DRAFT_42752 [Podospora didyma]
MSSIRSLLAVFLISSLLIVIQASALPNDDGLSDSSLDLVARTPSLSWEDPVPGTKAIFGRTFEIGKRECSSNGSNFCFPDNLTKACPNCETCCVDSGSCCGNGKTCCGTGCCLSGQTCSQGQCLSSMSTVTVVSTIFKTISHVATQVATVLVSEVDTSTIVSTIEVTVSSAATQTNVVWATVTTVVAKRDIANVRQVERPGGVLPGSPFLGKRGLFGLLASVSSRGSGSVSRGLAQGVEDGAHVKRQEGAASTITNFITQTVDVTSVISTVVTVYTTSHAMTTIARTITRVLNAQTTITVTSTLTITSRPPSITTTTTTASPTWTAPTTSGAAISSPTSSSSPVTGPALSTGAIAGVAIGGAVIAIIFVALVIFLVRRRRRPPPNVFNNNSQPSNDMYTRQPTIPAITFAPSAAHHAEQYDLDPNRMSPQMGMDGAASHNRSGSGFSTLVGSPTPGKKGDRQSGMTAGSGTTAVAEVHGTPAPDRFEVDGSTPIPQRTGSPQEQFQQNPYIYYPQGGQRHSPGQPYYYAEELDASDHPSPPGPGLAVFSPPSPPQHYHPQQPHQGGYDQRYYYPAQG